MRVIAFEMGDTVTVRSPGHRQDGRTGIVTYYGDVMGTWGVEIDGRTYGLFASELVREQP